MNSKLMQSLPLWIRYNEAVARKKWYTAEKYLRAIEDLDKPEVEKKVEEKVA